MGCAVEANKNHSGPAAQANLRRPSPGSPRRSSVAPRRRASRAGP